MTLHPRLNISVPPGDIKKKERFRCAKIVQKKEIPISRPESPEKCFRVFFLYG